MTVLRARFSGVFVRALTCSALAIAASACTSVGPRTGTVKAAATKSALSGIQILDVDDTISRSLRQAREQGGFSDAFEPAYAVGTVVGPGDVLEVTVWEAPPAALFGSSIAEARSAGAIQTSRSTSIPEFLVGPSGRISVPFAGLVPVAGRTLPQIEKDITNRLSGKAHLPQVMVRLVRNATSTVTVIGEVSGATRMPLTPKGERLLDALAAAGGTRQPVGKMTIQVSRGGVVHTMPLESVIRDPRQNIVLRTDDVITAFYQPYSFTVLGASGKNEEVNFEATGLTLAQAMGRVGGLQDGRADPKGVFLFRWEEPGLLGDKAKGAPHGPDGRVPVIYRVNMKDPATYFAMQNFDIRNRDVIYVTNSPVAELQRFVNIMASTVLPIVTVDNALSNK